SRRELGCHRDGTGSEHADQRGGLSGLVRKHGATSATGTGCEGHRRAGGKEHAGSCYGSDSVSRHDLHSNRTPSLPTHRRWRIRPGNQTENVIRTGAVSHDAGENRTGGSRRISEGDVLHSVGFRGGCHNDLVGGGGQRPGTPPPNP